MIIIQGDGSWGKLLAAGRCPMCTGAIEDNKCRLCRLEIGQGEDMSKSRVRKYKSSQEHLNKSLRKVEELFFESSNKDKWRGEEAEIQLLDQAVSTLQEAQSLLVKARLRVKVPS